MAVQLTISVSDESFARIEKKAKEAGKTPEKFIEEWAENFNKPVEHCSQDEWDAGIIMRDDK